MAADQVLSPVIRGEDGPPLAPSAGLGLGLRDHQTRLLRDVGKAVGGLGSRPVALVTVVNRCPAPLQRTDVSLTHGKWLASGSSSSGASVSGFPLPEVVVAPHSFSCAAAHGTRNKLVSPKCAGFIEFRASPKHTPVRLVWQIPDSSSRHRTAEDVFHLESSPGQNTLDLSLDTQTALDGLTLQVVVTVREARSVAPSAPSVDESSVFPVSQVAQACVDGAGAVIRLPHAESWKSEMNESHRRVVFRLHNHTTRALIRTEAACPVGAWRMEPPLVVGVDEIVEFGVSSFGVMTGTSGEAKFAFASDGVSTIESVDARSVVATTANTSTAAALQDLQRERDAQLQAGVVAVPKVDPLAFSVTRNSCTLRWDIPFLGGGKFSDESTDGFGNFRFHLDRAHSAGSGDGVVSWTLSEMVADVQRPVPAIETALPSATNPAVATGDPAPTVPVEPSSGGPAGTPPPSVPATSDPSSTSEGGAPPTDDNAGDSADADDGQKMEVYRRAAEATVAALTAKASANVPVPDNQIGINVYYRQALNLWEQGNIAKRAGDLDTAYIQWMRYLELVVSRLPNHLQYNLLRFGDEQTEHKGKARRVLTDLETIKGAILAREIAAAAADMQNFPDNPRDSVN